MLKPGIIILSLKDVLLTNFFFVIRKKRWIRVLGAFKKLYSYHLFMDDFIYPKLVIILINLFYFIYSRKKEVVTIFLYD